MSEEPEKQRLLEIKITNLENDESVTDYMHFGEYAVLTAAGCRTVEEQEQVNPNTGQRFRVIVVEIPPVPVEELKPQIIIPQQTLPADWNVQ